MELWVALSLTAAFMQNLRSALQKALTGRVGVLGATYARFVFAAPWAVLAAVVLAADAGGAPRPTAAFAAWAAVGALGQIVGTLLLLHLFSLRNFAVGNTFARTETVQTALLGLVLLGERIAPLPLAGILVSLVGVLLLSARQGVGGGAAAGIGLLSGTAYALSGVAYRAASLALEDADGFAIRAAFTLACVTVVQTLLMGLYLALRAPGGIAALLRQWRLAVPVGVVGAVGSLCWFAAYTLVPAAQVKAVGQVELVFSYLTAHLAFRERPTGRETLGIALVAGGIVVLVLAT